MSTPCKACQEHVAVKQEDAVALQLGGGQQPAGPSVSGQKVAWVIARLKMCRALWCPGRSRVRGDGPWLLSTKSGCSRG